ncbi:hypothetical protein [Actinokineospora globicatena]|uniref:hypothetical protein n=1 Tax=Actinokineospora globicatena TaxID=103729 RepID=UPI0020A50485|nr:hypothetical protein [Actinokineospora globicatena]MCP2301387.1 hypothetical protein [Actinokineospora globicatena]GLW76974.1 hypothetical protein Aglo01_14560 [Actinokineospora globicatena]GLW83808.1 hypothetical protein Aglo02_14480 [Actinokineospora globicatena]
MISGLDLARRFYHEAIAPTLDVPHSAGRLGSGSEVLGFDTAISADHEWGPRCQILVAEDAQRIRDELAHTLPKTFLGYPTHFDGNPIGSMAETDGPVNHRVDVREPSEWATSALARLPHHALQATLRDVLAAQDYRTRGELLADAYEAVAALHNATGLTDPVDPTRRDYYERPYPVIRADRFVEALRNTLDPELRSLPLTGAVDQWADSTDLLMDAAARRRATRLG